VGEVGLPSREERWILVGVVSLFGGSVRVQTIRAPFLRCVLEKIPVEAAVPAALELLAGCPTAPGSAAKFPNLKGCRRFVAGGPFLPVDFVNSPSPVAPELVLVASRPEPALAAALFASTAPSFPGRPVATRARPESDQAPFLSLAVPWHYSAILAVGPLLLIDHLLG
jgi:hypothetical protein